MELNRSDSQTPKLHTSPLKDSDSVRLRANSPRTASASPTTAPATSTTPMSVLYSVLLHAIASRSPVAKNSADHSILPPAASCLHSSDPETDMDDSVREAVRTEVERLFPYRGVTLASTCAAESAKTAPAQCFFGSAAKGEEGERNGCWGASLTRANAHDPLSGVDAGDRSSPVPLPVGTVAFTDAPAPSTTVRASKSVSKRRSRGLKVIIKSLPSKKALAAVAAAPVPAPSQPNLAEAPMQLSASPHMGSSGVGGVTVGQEVSSCRVPSAITDDNQRCTAVFARQLPDIQRQLERLFDDFAAAVEQCRAALQQQQQLRSSSRGAWQSARENRGVLSAEPSVSWLGAEASDLQHPQPTPPCTTTKHQRGSPTIILTDVLPHRDAHRHVSDLTSPDNTPGEWESDYGTVTTANGNGCASCAPSAEVESPRAADGPAEKATPSVEAENLPLGIVMIAQTIAEHLHAILHPTSTVTALEEEAVAALPGQGCRGNSGVSEPTALLAATTACRWSHIGAAVQERQSTGPEFFVCPAPSPDAGASSVPRPPPGSSPASPELWELRELVHSLLWARITTFLSRNSLKEPGDDQPMLRSTAAVGQREGCAHVQVPFWIWLYAACGLATDVIRAQTEAQRTSQVLGQVTERCKQPTSSSATTTASLPQPPSLSQLLPAVETLARQLQRQQYDRVQSTAETLLTASTFLSFTGVEMTERAVMKHLFPSKSGAMSSDALGLAALSHHSGRGTTHEANVAMESSSGNATTGVFDPVAVPSLISINTSLDRLTPSRDCNLSTLGGTGAIVVGQSGSNSGGARGSPPQRGQGANSIASGDAGSTAASATREEAQQAYSGSHARLSTAELYLQWLERADSARLAASSSRGEVKRFPDGADSEVKAAGGAAASSHTSPLPCWSEGSAYTQSFLPACAGDGEVDDRNTDITRGDGSSGRGRSSGDSWRSYTAAQRPSELFRVAAVMPSVELPPCLGRVEKEMHQARSAVQFARKLGTLYATQDMNTLLPLLPAVAREEPASPDVDLGSAHAVDGTVKSLGRALPPRRGTGDTRTPAAPAKLAGGTHPQCTWTGTPAASNPMTGGLPPLVATPSQVGADRLLSNHAFLSSHQVTANAASPALFPSVVSPSMEQQLLMERLNSCAAAIVPHSGQLFVNSTRALELAFSLAVVLLSHVMGEAVPKGEDVSAERVIPATIRGHKIAPAVAATATTATASAIVPRRPPSNAAAAAAGPSFRTEGKAATRERATPPPPRPLAMDLAKVFGFGSTRWRWQHLSAYVRETLITVALRALQRKDVTVTQELLHCITLDTAIAHHDAQACLHHPVSTPAAIKGAGKGKKGAGSALKKSRNTAKDSERQAAHLWVPPHGSSASFANVWFSSFACLVDASTHLVQGDYNIPSTLKEAVWHLAGLAQYFLLMRDRGYDMYGGQGRLGSATLPVCGSSNAAGLDLRTSSATSSAALQNFIASQLVEPAGKVLGVVLTFMDGVCQALLSDMESGVAVARQRREGVIFACDSSDDEGLLIYPALDDSVSLGGAGESPSLYRGDGGGVAHGIAANRSETSELQACWMELAVHYFLEIVDVLLDAALHLPQKPLYLYQLTVSASHTMTSSTDFVDGVGTAESSGVAGSPPLCGHGDLSNPVGATALGVGADSPLDRVQEFLSMYTSMVLQSAVNHFAVDGRHAQSRAATTLGTPSNVASAADEAPGDDSSRTFWEGLLSSVTAPASPAALGGPPSARRPPLPSSSTPASMPATAAVANGVVSREVAADSSNMRSTMWWPDTQFQRYSHLARIVEHAQLASLYLNSCGGKATASTAPAPSYLEAHRGSRDGAPSLQVSAVTALLNTSTGPCAQLLSIPYACPTSVVDTGCSSLVPGVGRTMSYERTGPRCTGSPGDQTPGCFPGTAHRRVLAERVLREVCGGLWIRVEVLRLLRLAAAPLDVDSFANFTTAATSVAGQVQDKAMQTRYKALASMRIGTESVLPKTYASTYVRLLFLRYVQAFYADMQAVQASGRATAPDCTASERPEGTSSATPLPGIVDPRAGPATHHGFSSRGEVTPCCSLGSPRTRSPASPFQHLSQLLWTHYCHQLLWALRELCWSCAEAHEAAASLSVASVFGRLLQMISGRGELGMDEFVDGCDGDAMEALPNESNSDLRGVGMPATVALDCSLKPHSTAEGSEMEGFVDFEVSSSDSSVMAVPRMSEGCERPPGPPQDFTATGESECRRESSEKAPQSLVSKDPTRTGGQLTVKISDLTSVSDLQERRLLGSYHHSISEDIDVAERSTTPLATSSTSVPAPSGTLVMPSVVLQLSLTGLKPPLYFTSSGDTAAAQENDFYREQSKLRQIAEETADRVLNAPSEAEPDAASYMSRDDEDEEEFDVEYETTVGNLAVKSKHAMARPASRETREAYPTASASTGATAVGAAPKPPALKIRTLSLEALGSPLYFTSTGDTGAFAERTIAPPLPRSPAPVFPLLNRPTPTAPAAAGVAHVDPTATVAPLKAAAKALTVPPPPPFSEPALPYVTATTVDGIVLPKLSLGSLGPPTYFTSAGDTGGFAEAQNQKPKAAAAAAKRSQSPSDAAGCQPESTVQSAASGRAGDTATATASAVTASSWSKAATTAAHFKDSLLLGELHPDSGFSGLADFAPKGDEVGGGGSERAEGVICDGRVGEEEAKGQGAARRRGGNGPSLKPAPVPEGGVPSLCAGQRPRNRSPRTSRAVLTPMVAPAVTVELILSICSIILQQDSGMIQYAYTVSSLTQNRVLPGMSSSSQRRWHTGSGSTAAAPGMSFTQRSDAAQSDRWRYTPQHSPSSFHVIQAMHNYLKDSRNSLVVDLLEEWVLVEYAEMERRRVERYELAYASQRQQECSQQSPHPPFPHSASGGNIGSVVQPRNLHQSHTGATDGSRSGRPSAAMLAGRYVLLRLLLPRAITPLVTQQNERRIGAGGYGTVTSGFVQELGTGRDAQLPPGWGQRGSRWLPAETRGSTAASDCRGGGGGITAHSAYAGLSLATTGERVTHGALDGLRAPWRAAVQRIAQAVCRCEVAIKRIPLNARGSESGNLPLCHAEVLAMYRLRSHPHIIPLLSFDNTKDEYIVVLPHYTQGSLRSWRQKHYPLGCAVLTLPPGMRDSCKSESTPTAVPALSSSTPAPAVAISTSLFATCARCLLQVLEAVTFMHDQHIRHGDIKCDNVLIASSHGSAKRGEMDLPTLPSSVCLCDFGSCDTCDDDDMQSLKHDIMAGEARFLAGRWGVGRGTEAIQPPELMSAKRRYAIFRRIMTTAAPVAAETLAPSSFLSLSDRADRGAHAAGVAVASTEHLPLRSRAGELMERAGREATELLRHAELSVDIWACGCLLYEMLTGRMLFGEARLGRLLVLAAVNDDQGQSPATAVSKANAAAGPLLTLPRSVQKAAVPTKASVGGDADLSFTPSVSRKALDDWERRDLEAAVGKRVVDFMSALLDLDPLQRPSAHEALEYWRGIMLEAGL
ncbi:hypothetical protein GH5_00284 [Leishmania sp. Ghana 2012 LV757]|uniref:hypothetical protein n=1 Tax=Leishmania sp. Ghana 2012 LV757 TaxID=2803181 RepID=UPI001B550664|nr:hypothetical protein GH5_00284 [Leishmania sp. Ghana 2012 LV757]